VLVVATTLVAVGCGASRFANEPRPPAPIDLSVYVSDARVSISPGSVGAGPVILIVTNQASRTESLTIAPAGSGRALAQIGPISPQATAQMQVDIESPGDYTLTTAEAAGNIEGSLAIPSAVDAAALRVGAKRPSASGALLQP
jgi:hypothetical protein